MIEPTSSVESLIQKARPRVSVIVPIYSGRDTVERCIKSILQQSFRRLELIVIDDGSEDESSAIVTRMLDGSVLAHRVVVHRQNLGIATTLNEGIKVSGGEYVLIVHQDCELNDDKYLEKAVDFLERNPDAVAVCGKALYPSTEFSFFEKAFMIWSGHFNKTARAGKEEISFAEHKCDLFKKDILLKAGGFDSAHFRASAEDQMTSWRIRNLGYRIFRNNELEYVQRYGKSLTTLRGLSEKVFKYGKTQSGVILFTRGSCVARPSRIGDQRNRIRNRLVGTLSATFFVSSWAALLLTHNIVFAGTIIAVLLARVLQMSLRGQQYDLRISNVSLLAASVVGFLADIIYSAGLLYGTFLVIARKRL